MVLPELGRAILVQCRRFDRHNIDAPDCAAERYYITHTNTTGGDFIDLFRRMCLAFYLTRSAIRMRYFEEVLDPNTCIMHELHRIKKYHMDKAYHGDGIYVVALIIHDVRNPFRCVLQGCLKSKVCNYLQQKCKGMVCSGNIPYSVFHRKVYDSGTKEIALSKERDKYKAEDKRNDDGSAHWSSKDCGQDSDGTTMEIDEGASNEESENAKMDGDDSYNRDEMDLDEGWDKDYDLLFEP
jgi:hypothetical protein